METFIINDIDVSECEYIKQGFCNCSGHELVDENGEINKKALTFNLYCKENPNCYYKKLQQASVRIKDLEERIMNHADKIDEYCSKLADKSQKIKTYQLFLESLRGYCSEFQTDLGQSDLLCIEIINRIYEVQNV